MINFLDMAKKPHISHAFEFISYVIINDPLVVYGWTKEHYNCESNIMQSNSRHASHQSKW